MQNGIKNTTTPNSGSHTKQSDGYTKGNGELNNNKNDDRHSEKEKQTLAPSKN